MGHAHGHPVKPAAVREVAHGDAPRRDLTQRLGRYLHVAEQRHLRRIDQPDLGQQAAFELDGQFIGRLAQVRALFLRIQRQSVLPSRQQPAHLAAVVVGRLAEQRGLVGQADAHQRAARTLRAVVQGRRHHARFAHPSHAPEQLAGPIHQRFIERHGHAAPRADEVQDTAIAGVAVFAQDQSLRAELHPLRLPCPAFHVGYAPSLVVDRNRLAGRDIDQVHLGHDPLAGRREHQRPRVDGLGRRRFLLCLALVNLLLACLRHLGGRRLVDTPMAEASFERFQIVGKLALDPFQVRQSRAIGKLVQHPSGNQIGNVGRGCGRKAGDCRLETGGRNRHLRSSRRTSCGQVSRPAHSPRSFGRISRPALSVFAPARCRSS